MLSASIHKYSAGYAPHKSFVICVFVKKAVPDDFCNMSIPWRWALPSRCTASEERLYLQHAVLPATYSERLYRY